MLSPAVVCFLMLFLLYYGLYSCFTYLCLYRARACCRLLSYAFLALLQPVPMLYLCICFACFATGFTYALLLCIGRACCRLGSSSASRSRGSCFALCLMPYALCLMPYALCLMPFRARMLSHVLRAALASPYALGLMPYVLCRQGAHAVAWGAAAPLVRAALVSRGLG